MAISDRIAVMNKGEIIEVETAEGLYFHPSTEFVARFIGRINAIPATVRELADDVVTLEIFGSTYRISEVPRQAEVQQTLSAFIRPESVQLFRKVEKGHLQGVITECTFLGQKLTMSWRSTAITSVPHRMILSSTEPSVYSRRSASVSTKKV